MITIRPERVEDYAAIREVNLLAFGGEDEPRLVETLRQSAGFIPELSLVAIEGEQVVGHILFSPVVIEAQRGSVPALALAPMAVRPEFQNQGIGTELMQFAMRQDGIKNSAVYVLGQGGFYQRFAF